MASRAWTGSTPSCAAAESTALARPAVEHRILADREREAAAQLFEGTRAVHARSTGLLGRRSQAPLRQAHEHQRGGDRGGADPVERRQRLAIGEPADEARRSPAGSEARGRRPAAARGRSHRPAGPGRSPGCRARARGRRSSRAGMICSPSASDDGQQHRGSEQRSTGTAAAAAASAPRPAATAIR